MTPRTLESRIYIQRARDRARSGLSPRFIIDTRCSYSAVLPAKGGRLQVALSAYLISLPRAIYTCGESEMGTGEKLRLTVNFDLPHSAGALGRASGRHRGGRWRRIYNSARRGVAASVPVRVPSRHSATGESPEYLILPRSSRPISPLSLPLALDTFV